MLLILTNSMLLAPTGLFEFREDIIFCILYFQVGSFDFYLLGNLKNVCVSN